MANGGAFDLLAAGDFNDPGIQVVTISVWGARRAQKVGSRNRD
jgi:hypothetical protein